MLCCLHTTRTAWSTSVSGCLQLEPLMRRKSLGLLALIAVPSLFLGLIFSSVLLLAPAKTAAADCGPVSVVVDGSTKVEGYSAEQLKNAAAAVVGAGKALNLSVKGQTISIMVALGESGLRVLDYGDGPGPDSRGLFQQRDNGTAGPHGPHGPDHQCHELHQGAAGRPGAGGAVGTDHCREQGPAQRRPVPLSEVLARGRKDRPGTLGRQSRC